MCEIKKTTEFDVKKIHDAEENTEKIHDAEENTEAKKEEPEIYPEQLFEQIESKYEAYAFASMIMASLPFPPLPVVVNCGEDMQDGMASSFDLTQQAIMADQANVYTTKKSDLVVMQKKLKILKNLHINMQEHFQDAVKIACDNQQSIAQCTNTTEWIEKAYEIYTTNLRKYLLDCYPNCTSDLRFFPIQDVPNDHVIMDHAKSHVQSMLLQVNNFDQISGAQSICSNLNTYADVIHYYACDLGSLPNE